VHVVTVTSLAERPEADEDLRALCYRTLIRSLANLALCVVPAPDGGEPEVYCTTPEVGFYHLPFDAEAVYRCIEPIVASHFAIENEIRTDLPPELWESSPVLESLRAHGRELDRLGVLPVPFPLREVLDERLLRHIYRLFGITGMSYGNLSARERVPQLGESTFWMSGRGVDKAALRGPGRDVFLVTGIDETRNTILVSVPPEHDETKRVSVDAVEHELIYRTWPEVGAIVHVHAWIDGALCTQQNHPCGTVELAREVVRLLAQTPDPARAVVGLKNHGLTITGRDLEEVFASIRGRLRTQVPMFA
jgi:ribulose-5-phosphate 4-epimerase/fuculose-1-phosphate aldolase